MRMELVIGSIVPFEREVREWQNVDPYTGIRSTNRVEADRWINGPMNTYGKVVDSKNIYDPNGKQHTQQKQLEILQAQTTYGPLQVVRAHTVQTSSSRSSISNILPRNKPDFFSDRKLNSNVLELENRPTVNGNHLTEDRQNVDRLTRLKSVSTEDLSSEQYSNDSDDMPWQRVSEIRRSFQFPKTTKPRSHINNSDIPLNRGTVLKIRQELENKAATERLSISPIENGHKSIITKLENSESTQNSVTTAFVSYTPIQQKISANDNSSTNTITVADHRISKIAENTFLMKDKTKKSTLSPTDWFSRRKSYGFEKMPTNNETSMPYKELSTDSGIGHSGDLMTSINGNHSQSTIITLNGYEHNEELTKKRNRHSIGVDDSKFMIENSNRTLISLNGIEQSEATFDFNRRSKRVDFCKTEVHFAAESGRVNIVKTDEKPPPSNNFKRRHRERLVQKAITNGEGLNLIGKSDAPTFYFGQEQIKPTEKTSIVDSNVTINIVETDSSTLSELDADDFDDDTEDEISLRGILKNKPHKPKPYHLGENENGNLWGVTLKPVGSAKSMLGNGQSSENGTKATSGAAEREQLVANLKTLMDATITGFSTKVNITKTQPRDENKYPIQNQPLQIRLQSSPPSSTIANSIKKLQDTAQKVNTNDPLKSTSLIMKTIRSANQFDKAMNNLCETVYKAPTPETTTTTNIILKTAVPTTKTTVSTILAPEKISPEPDNFGNSFKLITSLNSISKSNSASSITSTSTPKPARRRYSSSLDGDIILNDEAGVDNAKDDAKDEFDGGKLAVPLKKPIAAPRLKKITSASSLSNQLTQLRRMYENADDRDSGDDEIKMYFGQSSQSEEDTTELSGSWSRAQGRRYQQMDKVKNQASRQSVITGKSFQKTIEEKSESLATSTVSKTTISTKSDNLKLVNGARKLRDHELSYFGVNLSNKNNKSEPTEQIKNPTNNLLGFNVKSGIVKDTSEKFENHKITKTKLSLNDNIKEPKEAVGEVAYVNIEKKQERERLSPNRVTKISTQLNGNQLNVGTPPSSRRSSKQQSPLNVENLDTIAEEKPIHSKSIPVPSTSIKSSINRDNRSKSNTLTSDTSSVEERKTGSSERKRSLERSKVLTRSHRDGSGTHQSPRRSSRELSKDQTRNSVKNKISKNNSRSQQSHVQLSKCETTPSKQSEIKARGRTDNHSAANEISRHHGNVKRNSKAKETTTNTSIISTQSKKLSTNGPKTNPLHRHSSIKHTRPAALKKSMPQPATTKLKNKLIREPGTITKTSS